MKCRICSEYLGFADNVICENKSCVSKTKLAIILTSAQTAKQLREL